jgi:uncharacterized protein
MRCPHSQRNARENRMKIKQILMIMGFVWAVGLAVSSLALDMDLQPVAVGPATFQVEMARTAQERARGLMFRRELPRDRGMLFVQPPGPAAFWMKNTYIPLDLLYFDADGRLLQIVTEAPPCVTPMCPIYPSKTANVRYILEINAGEAARRGIQVGDRLRLE